MPIESSPSARLPDTSASGGKKPDAGSSLVWILSLLAAAGPMSIDMYLPGLPTIAQDFGVPAAAVQMTLSAFFVGFGVGQLLSGPLSDRYGRRPMLLLGSAIYVAMSIGCALAPTVEWLSLFRLLQAFGGGAAVVITRAVIRDRFDMAGGARMMSQMMFVVAFAPLFAPLLGGQLLIWFGWRPIFWVLVAYGVVCFAAVALALPESLPAASRVGRRLGTAFVGYFIVLRNRQTLGCMLAGGLSFAAMFAYISGTPFVFIEYYQVPMQYYGLLFGLNVIALMIGARLNSRYVMRVGVRYLLMAGVVICAVAGLATLVAGLTGWGGLWGLLVGLWFSVGSLPLIGANAISLASEPFPAQAGAVSALFGMSQFGIGAFSGALVGVFHDGTPFPMTAVIAVCSMASLLVALVLLRQR